MYLFTPVGNHIIVTKGNKLMTASFLPSFIYKLNALKLYLALSRVNCVAGGWKEFLIPLQRQKETVVPWGKKKNRARRRQGHNIGFMGEWEWASNYSLCYRSNRSSQQILPAAFSVQHCLSSSHGSLVQDAPAFFSELLCVSQDKCPLTWKNSSN